MPVDPNNCGPETSNFCSRGEAIGGGTVGLGILGAGIGALVKSERWTPIKMEFFPRATKGHGVGVGVAVQF